MKLRSMILMFLIVFSGFPKAADDSRIILNGAGATFPYPLYRQWISVYQKQSGLRITYQGVGSGGGIKKLFNREVDFGGTDAYLTDEELQTVREPVLHIPTCVGAVVITYNLQDNPALKFNPQILSNIFSGKIRKWSDPRIKAVNPDISFPDIEIMVVHRSESSGTTFIFTDYMSKVNSEWEKQIGRGKLVDWPVGFGVEGNPGIAEMVKKIQGSIGYVELSFAESHQLPAAKIKNRSGRYILPTLSSVTQAASVSLPEDTRLLLTDTPNSQGYPISAFTYLIFYQEQNYNARSREHVKALADFLWWMIHEGQNYNQALHYAPLPESAVKNAEIIIRNLKFNGSHIL